MDSVDHGMCVFTLDNFFYDEPGDCLRQGSPKNWISGSPSTDRKNEKKKLEGNWQKIEKKIQKKKLKSEIWLAIAIGWLLTKEGSKIGKNTPK